MTAGADAGSVASSRRQRWFGWVPLGAAGFTTLCCLGFSAALSLATGLGATFLTEDSTLRPILAVTLGLTVATSALTYWRHRRPGPCGRPAADLDRPRRRVISPGASSARPWFSDAILLGPRSKADRAPLRGAQC